MRYIADHDFHIHSTLSPCSNDPLQIPENLLKYAKKNDFRKIALTNHFWDEDVESVNIWHPDERFSFISKALPLPQAEGIDFLFGCEGDMDYNFTLGISEKRFDEFQFMAISTTHLTIDGYTVKEPLKTPEEAADIWLKRLEKLLEKNLPWHKTGIAHLTSEHFYENDILAAVKCLKDNDLYNIFNKCAEKGVGIELNIRTLNLNDEEKKILLKPFQIAKDCGCKFYLGSDSHNSNALKDAKANFEDVIKYLDLQETDKFPLCK